MTKFRKGIILAGGSGTRLSPITKGLSKQLIPIYNKPMIYYPLSILMLANIDNVLIISQEIYLPFYKELFGDGSHLGLRIEYSIQNAPGGIPEAFIIGEKFIGKDNVALILGDNIFYGSNFSKFLEIANNKKNVIFSKQVDNPTSFGVIEYKKNIPHKIIEKPKKTKSNQIVTGLYFYENNVIKLSKKLKKSKRGELEITDLNNILLDQKNLEIISLPRATLWLDTGTVENLHQCSQLIYSIEKNTNIMIANLEEISLKKGKITKSFFRSLVNKMPKNDYSIYLSKFL